MQQLASAPQGSAISALKGTVKRVPAVRAWLEDRLRQRFLSPEAIYVLFRGIRQLRGAWRHLPASQEFSDPDVERIEAVGYTLRDAWPVPERALYVPLHPERSFGCFSGLYFRADRVPAQ